MKGMIVRFKKGKARRFWDAVKYSFRDPMVHLYGDEEEEEWIASFPVNAVRSIESDWSLSCLESDSNNVERIGDCTREIERLRLELRPILKFKKDALRKKKIPHES